MAQRRPSAPAKMNFHNIKERTNEEQHYPRPVLRTRVRVHPMVAEESAAPRLAMARAVCMMPRSFGRAFRPGIIGARA
jgi:hypothetical protein